MERYERFTLRNKGYISNNLQDIIKKTTILIAGCGIGSTIAEVALRSGFVNIMLVDGDVVEAHNLNRQVFTDQDIGTPKVFALKKHLLQIFPNANIQAFNQFLTKSNIDDFVIKADLIFDTVDFLDLPAITYLHDAAFHFRKPIISAVSVGWGAASMLFNVSEESFSKNCCGFRKMFNLPESGSVENCSYTEHFKPFLISLEDKLNPEVISAMSKALVSMEDGQPCPAPHLAIGSFSVGALAISTAIKILNNQPLIEGKVILLDIINIIS